MSDYRIAFTNQAVTDLTRLALDRTQFSRDIARALPDPYGGLSVRRGKSDDDRSVLIGHYAVSYMITNTTLLRIMTVTRVR
ncbi:hypothetical protein AB0O47_39455 [Streptomyces noursei]|uniref:hypothetical protein n=1 Tax=Streptomyces noursei TaxID=1971 RepID=UPI00344F3B6B